MIDIQGKDSDHDGMVKFFSAASVHLFLIGKIAGLILWVWAVIIGFTHGLLAGILTLLIPILPVFYWAFKLSKFHNGDLYLHWFSIAVIAGATCYLLSFLCAMIAAGFEKVETR